MYVSFLAPKMLIINRYGYAKLMRGLLMSSNREAIFTAGYLGMPKLFTNMFENKLGLNKKISYIGATVTSGICASTLSHPFDTIKTCMQGDIENKKYSTVTNTGKKLYQSGGFKRFYNGWFWRTGRMILAVSILNLCKNSFDELLPQF